MELLWLLAELAVIVFALRWMYRAVFTRRGGRVTRKLGSSLRRSRAAFEAAAEGILLGASVGVGIQAFLSVIDRPFDWLGLVAFAGLITLLFWMVPSFDSGTRQPSAVAVALQVAVGSAATGLAVTDVVNSNLPTSDKALFLVPLAALMLIGTAVAGAAGITRIAGVPSGWRGIGAGSQLALLSVEIAFAMHLPSIASILNVPASRALVLLACSALLCAAILWPPIRVPIGLVLAALAVTGDWSQITPIANTPIPHATVTTTAMAVEVAAVYLAGYLRSWAAATP